MIFSTSTTCWNSRINRTAGGSEGLRDLVSWNPPSRSQWPASAASFCITTFSGWQRPFTFHSCRPPFVDGNKRTGLLAMLAFLDLNGYAIVQPFHALVDITLSVASGSMSKAQVVSYSATARLSPISHADVIANTQRSAQWPRRSNLNVPVH